MLASAAMAHPRLTAAFWYQPLMDICATTSIWMMTALHSFLVLCEYGYSFRCKNYLLLNY